MSADSSQSGSQISVLLHSQAGANPASPPFVPGNEIIPQQADSDERLIELWLHGRPMTTQVVYRADVDRFLRFVQKPIRTVTLGELQGFGDSLEDVELAPATRHRILSVVKSMLGFAHDWGMSASTLDVGCAYQTSPIGWPTEFWMMIRFSEWLPSNPNPETG